jgi:hypothetical protein
VWRNENKINKLEYIWEYEKEAYVVIMSDALRNFNYVNEKKRDGENKINKFSVCFFGTFPMKIK